MKVIFFDGVCGLCNGFVDFMLKVDKKTQFKFSPLQSDFAAQKLPSQYTKDLTSVVYLNDQGELFTKAEAVLHILNEVGGAWKLATIGYILPQKFLNTAYDLVAQNRYNLFGKKETCRLPTPEERARFVIDVPEAELRP